VAILCGIWLMIDAASLDGTIRMEGRPVLNVSQRTFQAFLSLIFLGFGVADLLR